MVEALIAAGANPDAGNHFGLTPRSLALARFPGGKLFADVLEKPVQMPEPRIQNTEHLADHYHPRFKIPNQDERETIQVGQAVDYDSVRRTVQRFRSEGKQDIVKVRITARSGRRPKVRYTATVETLLDHTHLAPGTTEVEFGPENIASVYVPRPAKKK